MADEINGNNSNDDNHQTTTTIPSAVGASSRARRGEARRSPEGKEPLLVAVGAKIRRLREAKGYSQEPFALMAGIDRSYYGAVERGRYSVTMVNLARIAVALDVEVGELFPTRQELREFLKGEATKSQAA